MESIFWLVFGMLVAMICGLALGYVIWGLEGDRDNHDIPTSGDW